MDNRLFQLNGRTFLTRPNGMVEELPPDFDPNDPFAMAALRTRAAVQSRFKPLAERVFTPGSVGDKLLGESGERYQLWPERMVRSAVTAPGEALQGRLEPKRIEPKVPGQWSEEDEYLQQLENRRAEEEKVVRAMDVGGLAMTGVFGGPKGPGTVLGAGVVRRKGSEKITPQEKQSIVEWMEGNHGDMSMGGNPHLDSIFNKTELKDPMTLYRGATMSSDELAGLKEGSAIKSHGYTATTDRKNATDIYPYGHIEKNQIPVEFVIDAPKGFPSIHVSKAVKEGKLYDESEYLLPRNTVFKVIKIEEKASDPHTGLTPDHPSYNQPRTRIHLKVGDTQPLSPKEQMKIDRSDFINWAESQAFDSGNLQSQMNDVLKSFKKGKSLEDALDSSASPTLREFFEKNTDPELLKKLSQSPLSAKEKLELKRLENEKSVQGLAGQDKERYERLNSRNSILRSGLGDEGKTPVTAPIGQLSKEPFYSAVEHALEQSNQGVGTPEQWLGMLKNAKGVKPEELNWLGVEDFLKGKDKVTRQDLQDFVKENQIEVKDVTKNNSSKLTLKENNRLDDLENRAGRLTPNEFREFQELLLKEELNQNTRPKFQEYQLPGGKDYGELLLTLPRKKATISDIEEGLARTDRDGNPVIEFRSSHWDEPNVLAHVRYNTRIIDDAPVSMIEEKVSKASGVDPKYMGSGMPDVMVKRGIITPQEAADWSRARGFISGYENQPGTGKKTLFLEEIQSDWHQKGRKEGYKGRLTKQEKEERHSIYSLPEKVRTLEQQKRMEELDKKSGGPSSPPDAPFKKTWPELALKRMFRYAAENDYDAIAWTPGEVQAARYDLSKQVKEIEYKKLDDGDIALGVTDINGKSIPNIPYSVKPEKLSDYVGKEIAEKILNNAGDTAKKLKGENLKIGGEGMKGFYDDILPKAAMKYGKEHGARVEQREISTKNEPLLPRYAEIADSKQNVHFMLLPPTMKETALRKGYPLFSNGVMLTPVEGNPFAPEEKKK